MKRSRRALAGRSAPQRLGVGPAGRGHDEHVVAGQRPRSSAAAAAPGRRCRACPGSRAPPGGPPPSSGHHAGAVERRAPAAPGSGPRSAPSAPGPNAGTRSRPPSPAGRRRPPWAGGRGSSRGSPATPASASRRRAKRWMSASTTCSVTQFMGGCAPGPAARPGLQGRRRTARCPGCGDVGHDPDAGRAPGAPPGARAPGGAPRGTWCRPRCSRRRSRSRIARRSRPGPGTGPTKMRRRSSLTPRTPRLEDASRSGLTTMRSWAS